MVADDNVLQQSQRQGATRFLMKTTPRHRRTLTLGTLLAPLAVFSSASAQGILQPVAQFPLSDGPLIIRQAVQPQHPFTVTRSTGVILGLQNGNVELWRLPT